MKRRKLPIGIQNLREIREEGHYYVDKTPYIEQLLAQGKHFFLSRPRRFGKSLFVDTIKELFEGSEALFQGLDIHPRWDWDTTWPVVRLSFASGHFQSADGLRADVVDRLTELETAADVQSRASSEPGRLRHLLRTLHEQTGQRVVLLVDEYDKPILDALHEPETAAANRDYLRGLYSVIKDSDAHLKLSFITGVTKFSKVSLFSGLNNLEDLTLDKTYSSICGYTDDDLESVFEAELDGLDRDEIKDWYNGYRWLGEEKVYNPFDILLLFRRKEYRAWWSETGAPKFLVDTLTERKVGSITLEQMSADDELLSKFDVGDIGTEALLFQAGYLTIAGEQRLNGRVRYQLDYPNREVRQALNGYLLAPMMSDDGARAAREIDLATPLRRRELEDFESKLRSLFASIPHEWHIKNPMGNYEGYYASVFFSCLAAAGLDIAVEDSTNLGRVDMSVRLGTEVFVFEFKILERAGPGAAMDQLNDRGYAEKYLGTASQLHLVGIEFTTATRNIETIDVRTCA